MDRELVLLRPPSRIVSLVPSDTHTLFALGLGERVVGRTRYCIEPEGSVEAIPVCGGTKDVDVDAVAELGPDLILANKEENSRAGLEALAARGLPVFVSFPRRVADGIAHAARLARVCGVAGEPAVKELFSRGYQALREAEARRPEQPTAAFVPVWMDPLMTFNADTYASDVLSLVGLSNVFAGRPRYYPLAADTGTREPLGPDRVGERDTRYPRITMDELEGAAPRIVLLPDEPHPFSEDDARAFGQLAIPAAEHGGIAFVSGKDLFWYGAWAIDGLARLRGQVDALLGAG